MRIAENSSVQQLQQSTRISVRHGYARMRIKLPQGKGKVVAIKLVASPKKQAMRTNAIYYGAAFGTSHTTNPTTPDQAFITGLARAEQNTKSAVLSVLTGSGGKFFYARPKVWGLAAFQLETAQGLVEGGMLAPTVVSITDAQTTAVEEYYLYESINTDLTGTLYIL